MCDWGCPKTNESPLPPPKKKSYDILNRICIIIIIFLIITHAYHYMHHSSKPMPLSQSLNMGHLNLLLMITWIVLALFWLVPLHFCDGNTTNAVLLTNNSMFIRHELHGSRLIFIPLKTEVFHVLIWGLKMINVHENKKRWINQSNIKNHGIPTM